MNPSPAPHPRRGPRRSAVVAAAAVALFALAGCSSSGETSSSGSASPGDTAVGAPAVGGAQPAPAADKAESASAAASAAGAAGGALSGDGGTALNGAVARQIVRNASITLEVVDLQGSAARVRAAATGLGGFVASESTGLNAPGDPITIGGSGKEEVRQAVRGQSVLVLRIPVSQMDAALSQVDDVGKELSRSASAQDVTGDVADLTSRTATAKASVARIRVLLGQAKTIQEIALLESELTRRESDLEALQARLATLSDQAALSTLTVVLQTPAVAPTQPEPDNSFVAGLKAGWQALVDSTRALLVLAGALLPFAVVGALVLVPLWRWWRRRGARPGAPTAWSAGGGTTNGNTDGNTDGGGDGGDQPSDAGTPVGAGSR